MISLQIKIYRHVKQFGNIINQIFKNGLWEFLLAKKAIKNSSKIFNALEISVDYDITLITARKYLNILVKYKILGSYKGGRTKAYIAPANLHEIIKAK